MKNLYNEEYLRLYQELLSEVKEMENDGATAVQFCCCGKDFNSNPKKRLMVVGRAINGWDNNVNKCIESEMFSAANPDIVKYIIDTYGSTSAFWRITRSVVESLGLAGVDDWYDNLEWNNLYKIGPSGGGNPKERLCQAQFKLCNKILKHEINTLQPEYILFITGWWFNPFVSGVYNKKLEVAPDDKMPFKITPNLVEGSIVIGAGTIELDRHTSKVVLCHRPEKRAGGEEKSKNEIIEAFDSLK